MNMRCELESIVVIGDDEAKIKCVFIEVICALHKYNWAGACHASTVFMFILLKELEVDVQMCTGWIKCDKAVFGHSWLEYKKLPIDAAVSLGNVMSFPPIFLGKSVLKSQSLQLEYTYGYRWKEKLESPMDTLSREPLGSFLAEFPEPLWLFFHKIAKELGLTLKKESLIEKYFYSMWEVKN
ncbi:MULTISPECIES: hypothetical protein [Vibrio harveyi group]|uniref:hypothetical protein n=1 Tax=Vibrio harveyi group TaxID=717610 RepID=UPI001124B340|nr:MULTISPECIES: hypothetical protein [Vibrio harveyi group]MBS9926219.1 hypothetical protein [Vibrio alginolyticus]MCQ9076175.1 hypothetical protein [Vibrio harveyi]HDM8151521.1 hypothetical protein [Vibrio harveyi]